MCTITNPATSWQVKSNCLAR